MTEKRKTSTKKNLNYNLDGNGLLTIDKLSKWTKLVGIMNIILGAIYCLTIFVFAIPTVIIGIINIVFVSERYNTTHFCTNTCLEHISDYC